MILMHCNFELYSVSILLEAVVWRCSAEKVFLEILQNSQENACARVPKGLHNTFWATTKKVCNFIKKRLWHRRFPMNFAKLLWTPFLTEQLWWLLLFCVNLSKHFKKDLIATLSMSVWGIFFSNTWTKLKKEKTEAN